MRLILALFLLLPWIPADRHAAEIYRSTDQGRSWSRSGSGLPSSRINALTLAGSTVVAGTESGIFLSLDSGKTWSGSAASLGAVVSFASLDGTLYAGTKQSGALASTDDGKTWKPVNQ
ncbi:MAG TPA: hypothetical protein VFR31_17420, partial [Thermoanaerobaculia bacterium]|nr:hypothetical protein [Thermoanaerobaculia bacterium]